MSFGDALKLVKRGMGMRLPNRKPDVVIRAQFPDEKDNDSPLFVCRKPIWSCPMERNND